MVKAHGSTVAQRAKIVQEYDRLIAEFGEEPFRPTAARQCSVGLSKGVDEVDSVTPKERHQLLKEVTEKSLRCAELIEKALVASDKFKRMDEKIAKAHREYETGGGDGDAGDDEDMDGASDEENDEEGALLLRDLITASEEMQLANKNLAKVDVVAKSAPTSRELLSSSEQMLQASLDSASMGENASAISEEFRDLYMEEFTSAFGDELDQFRQEDRFESKDVTYLISCIQSGADIFTPLQKKLFLESAQSRSTN